MLKKTACEKNFKTNIPSKAKQLQNNKVQWSVFPRSPGCRCKSLKKGVKWLFQETLACPCTEGRQQRLRLRHCRFCQHFCRDSTALQRKHKLCSHVFTEFPISVEAGCLIAPLGNAKQFQNCKINILEKTNTYCRHTLVRGSGVTRTLPYTPCSVCPWGLGAVGCDSGTRQVCNILTGVWNGDWVPNKSRYFYHFTDILTSSPKEIKWCCTQLY